MTWNAQEAQVTFLMHQLITATYLEERTPRVRLAQKARRLVHEFNFHTALGSLAIEAF